MRIAKSILRITGIIIKIIIIIIMIIIMSLFSEDNIFSIQY